MCEAAMPPWEIIQWLHQPKGTQACFQKAKDMDPVKRKDFY